MSTTLPSMLQTLTFTTLTSLTAQISLVLLVIACCTRLSSGLQYQSDVSSSERPCRIATLPYWLPYLGHLFPLTLNPARFLQKCSRRSANGIVSLNLFSEQHYIVSKPSSINAIFEGHNAALSFDPVRLSLLANVFGARTRFEKAHLNAHSDAQACLLNDLSPGLAASQITHKTVLAIQEHTPSLVSFSESIVDQSYWERTAYPILRPASSPGPSAVEVSLFPLIRKFVGHAALPSLMGTEFLDVYPAALDDLWDLDSGFKYLTLGLPRWLPIPSLTKAYIARRNLLEAMGSFHGAMNQISARDGPHQPWTDLGDVDQIVRGRSAVWRAHVTPQVVKGPCDLSLLWAMSTKSSNLVFWMLVQIWTVSGLVQQVRDEISPFTKAWQPLRTFRIAEHSRLRIDVDSLVRSCPLLKACFYECIRLYSAPTSMRSIVQTFEVHETREDTSDNVSHQSYIFESGKFVAAALGVHHFDPHYFESPCDFRPERFLRPSESSEGELVVDEGTLRPWGMGATACPGRAYAEREVLAFVAGILALWDFEPADSRGWIIPGREERPVISVPSTDIRIRIKPRSLQQWCAQSE